jgi:hypothetical protein
MIDCIVEETTVSELKMSDLFTVVDPRELVANQCAGCGDECDALYSNVDMRVRGSHPIPSDLQSLKVWKLTFGEC